MEKSVEIRVGESGGSGERADDDFETLYDMLVISAEKKRRVENYARDVLDGFVNQTKTSLEKAILHLPHSNSWMKIPTKKIAEDVSEFDEIPIHLEEMLVGVNNVVKRDLVNLRGYIHVLEGEMLAHPFLTQYPCLMEQYDEMVKVRNEFFAKLEKFRQAHQELIPKIDMARSFLHGILDRARVKDACLKLEFQMPELKHPDEEEIGLDSIQCPDTVAECDVSEDLSEFGPLQMTVLLVESAGRGRIESWKLRVNVQDERHSKENLAEFRQHLQGKLFAQKLGCQEDSAEEVYVVHLNRLRKVEETDQRTFFVSLDELGFRSKSGVPGPHLQTAATGQEDTVPLASQGTVRTRTGILRRVWKRITTPSSWCGRRRPPN